MSKRSRPDRRRPDQSAGYIQRRGARKLSLEERFRQNDSLSRFRAEALRSRQKSK